MDLSDLHGTDGSSESSTADPIQNLKNCDMGSKFDPATSKCDLIGPPTAREHGRLKDKVEEMSQELLVQLDERDDLVNAIQLKNRFIGTSNSLKI